MLKQNTFHPKNCQKMNLETKVIKNKVGLLNLAKELGNVSQACKVLGYVVIVFTVIKSYMMQVETWLYVKSVIKTDIKESD